MKYLSNLMLRFRYRNILYNFECNIKPFYQLFLALMEFLLKLGATCTAAG